MSCFVFWFISAIGQHLEPCELETYCQRGRIAKIALRKHFFKGWWERQRKKQINIYIYIFFFFGKLSGPSKPKLLFWQTILLCTVGELAGGVFFGFCFWRWGQVPGDRWHVTGDMWCVLPPMYSVSPICKFFTALAPRLIQSIGCDIRYYVCILLETPLPRFPTSGWRVTC